MAVARRPAGVPVVLAELPTSAPVRVYVLGAVADARGLPFAAGRDRGRCAGRGRRRAAAGGIGGREPGGAGGRRRSHRRAADPADIGPDAAPATATHIPAGREQHDDRFRSLARRHADRASDRQHERRGAGA